jgi:hypothetical protein
VNHLLLFIDLRLIIDDGIRKACLVDCISDLERSDAVQHTQSLSFT